MNLKSLIFKKTILFTVLVLTFLLTSVFLFSEQSRLFLANIVSLPGRTHTINIQTNDSLQGLVEANDEQADQLVFQVKHNQSFTIQAIASEGYTFSHWKQYATSTESEVRINIAYASSVQDQIATPAKDNVKIIHGKSRQAKKQDIQETVYDNPYTFKPSQDLSFTAFFEEAKPEAPKLLSEEETQAELTQLTNRAQQPILFKQSTKRAIVDLPLSAQNIQTFKKVKGERSLAQSNIQEKLKQAQLPDIVFKKALHFITNEWVLRTRSGLYTIVYC